MSLPGGGDDVPGLARELVAVPSHEDETAAGDRVERWLRRETDAEVVRDDVGNVLARRGPAPAALALVGHHDVVPPDDAQIVDGRYRVEERDGRLYGRGAADMKGALAAAMCAFRDADLPGQSTSAPRAGGADGGAGEQEATGVLLASFVGEETGGRGARHAVESGVAPARAVVCEGSTGYSAPGVTDVAVAHKGRRASTITARGTAAHASEPGAGENAVYRACDAVDVIRELEAPTADVLDRDLAGSVAVTGVEGGTAWNVVPDRCEVVVDERTVPDARADLSRVEALEGVSWTVDQDLPPMACGDRTFADAVLAAAGDAQDGDPERVVKPHATDAGWLAQAGTACVVCGPAEPGEAHTADESVSLDVLRRCYRIYRRTAGSLAGAD